MFYTQSTPFRLEQPDFLTQAGSYLQQPLSKFRRFCKSQHAEAFLPFLKATQKIQYVADIIFNTYLPDQQLTGFWKEVKDRTTNSLSFLSDIAGKVKVFFNFLDLAKLPLTIRKNIKERKKARESHDEQKLFHANLKAVSITATIFDIPEIVSKFAGLFSWAVPAPIKQVNAVCNAISMLLSTGNLFAKKQECLDTEEFLKNLKRVRYQTIINEFVKQQQIAPPFFLQNYKELRSFAKTIKINLKNSKQELLLEKIKHSANQAFISYLTKEIEAQPSLIEKQFKVKFSKNYSNEIELPSVHKKKTQASNKLTLKKNFFDRLSCKYVQDEPRVAACAVKNLKIRLRDVKMENRFTLMHKTINLIPSTLGTIVALTAFLAPHLALAATLTPIAAAFTGLLALATVINIYYCHHRQKMFMNAMEKVTTKPKAPKIIAPPFPVSLKEKPAYLGFSADSKLALESRDC